MINVIICCGTVQIDLDSNLCHPSKDNLLQLENNDNNALWNITAEKQFENICHNQNKS